MNADLKLYSNHKDSCIPWFGKVPVHWEVVRLGQVLSERGETNSDGTITQVLSVLRDRGVILYEDKGNIGNKKSEDITRYKIVHPRDIVINCMNVIIGSVGLSRYTGCLSPVYYVFKTRSRNDLPEYFNAVFAIKPFQQSLVRIGNGILAHRMRIPMELLKHESLPRPPLAEQTAIVSYLHAIEQKVGRFIRNRRRLIEVLNEQKQAIINRAVTRGLDPNVPLKPSGIDWLGDIPAHWNPVNLGRVVDILTGFPFKSESFTENPNDVTLLRGINVSPGRIRWDEVVHYSEELTAELARFALQEGDVVLGMDRPLISGGIRVALVKKEDLPCLLLQRVTRLRSHSGLDQNYLYMLLHDRRYADYLAPIFTGISVPHISPAQIAEYQVVLPPENEQRLILNHITYRIRSIETAFDRAEREIDLIREYRIRLIADVVTGKVDVRHLASVIDGEEAVFELEDQDEVLGEDEILGDEENDLVEETTDAGD